MTSKKELTIVKIGGNVINDKDALQEFLADFSKLEGLKILVHGGGKRATEMAASLGLKPKMIGGRRITDLANLAVVTMVYAGLLNKGITASLQKNGCNAIGLSGADANCIKAHKRIVKDIDYGFAGDVDGVNVESLQVFIENKMTPVFCAITHDLNGQLLNTNADTIASEIATGLAPYYNVSLVYAFEKKGVLKSVEDEDSVIAHIDSGSYEELKEQHIIADGMLPKMENCFNALKKGVAEVVIGNPSIIINKDQLYTTLTL